MNQSIFKQSISLARAIASSRDVNSPIGCVWSTGFAPLAPTHYRIQPVHFTGRVDWRAVPVKVDPRLPSPI